MIPFNIPTITGNEIHYIAQSLKEQRLSGGGLFTKKCEDWIEKNFECKKALLVPSCTHALEMAAMLVDVKEGDEIIMPSYTFVSTANAFAIRGAKIVFIDIRPDTMNIDEKMIEGAITEKTKAIVVVHYAGVACEMDQIMKIASKYNLYVIEDAAQAVMSTYKNRALGTIGHIGCYSFHETKNYTCGEGGAILINNTEMIERAEIIREKGTDRSKFFRGQVDKYTWVDIGSSFLLGEINAAFLYAQLEQATIINQDRLKTWEFYYNHLFELQEKGYIYLPFVPEDCKHNGHLFYIKVASSNEQKELIEYLKQRGIMAVFHYVPLHSSKAGMRYGKFHGMDVYTTSHSKRIVRLPMYYRMNKSDVKYICDTIKTFYEKR